MGILMCQTTSGFDFIFLQLDQTQHTLIITGTTVNVTSNIIMRTRFSHIPEQFTNVHIKITNPIINKTIDTHDIINVII